MTITINAQASDVVTIQISDADQIQLNTTAIVLVDGEGGSVAWGDIAGTLSAQTDLQDALDLKLDSADYNDRFLGLYASFFDLEAAHPTANAGDYAQVDLGIGSDVIIYAWDVSDEYWAAVGSSPIANTDALPEGSSNLYFTSQRVRDTALTGLSTATATAITASDSLLSAAGKLQAQISAGGSARKFAVGYWYNQQALAHNTTLAFSAAATYYNYFFMPHAITISKLNAFFSSGAAGRSIKIRFYDFATGAAVSPLYEWAATIGDTNEYTLPSPLTLPAGSYYIGLHNNGLNSGNQQMRSILSQAIPQLPTTTVQITGSAAPTGLIVSAAYADALPASVPAGAIIYAGNQPAIGLFIAG